MLTINRLTACSLVSLVLGATTSAQRAASTPTQASQPVRDWTTFNVDVARTGVFTGATGITAANVGSLQRRQIQIDGVVDASPIYLHGAMVNGAAHDTIFVTTSYGRTMAIDAASGATLWQHTPAGHDTWAGSRQITNATPVADPDPRERPASDPGSHPGEGGLLGAVPATAVDAVKRPELEILPTLQDRRL